MTTLESDSYTLALPADWRITSLAPPASITGPNTEHLLVNSVIIVTGASASFSGPEYEAVRGALQQNAADSMLAASTDPRLNVLLPLNTVETDNGLYAELHCGLTDGTGYFSEFSIAGPRTLVFVTLEGPSTTADSIEVVRNAILSIRWSAAHSASAPRTPRKRRWWPW